MPEPDGSTSPSYVPRVHAALRHTGVRHLHYISTLVFADLSGFTPLSERFAKRGQVGAELLTDLLNGLFAPMLDCAVGYGGDLLKFGGDALLILFRGDDHATRACDAAVEMRIALREAAAVVGLDAQTEILRGAGRIDIVVEMAAGAARGDEQGESQNVFFF